MAEILDFEYRPKQRCAVQPKEVAWLVHCADQVVIKVMASSPWEALHIAAEQGPLSAPWCEPEDPNIQWQAEWDIPDHV